MNLYKISFMVAVICLTTAIVLVANENGANAGSLLIAFFILMAIGFRGFQRSRDLLIPLPFLLQLQEHCFIRGILFSWNGFTLSTLIKPLIMLIMFGMGTSMSIYDFAGVVKMPKGVLIGVVSHFIIMPFIGYTLASLTNFPPEVAAGIILVGCSPNGTASNVISYLAKANLALSVTITAVSTMLAPFVTPFLMKLLAGAFVEIHPVDMMFEIFQMVIIPIGAGLLFNHFLHGK
jgi:BASS family bile acid:Na+ symporter